MQLTSGVGALLLPRERMASVPETTPHASPHLLRVEPPAHCPADVLGLSVDVVWACPLLAVARALRNTWGSMAAHAGPRSSAPPVPVRDQILAAAAHLRFSVISHWAVEAFAESPGEE